MGKIAITGNIGSGKTSVLQFFKKKNYLTISSDEIIREIYSNSTSRDIVLKKISVGPNNYKQEIVKKMEEPSFNYKLKKTLYPLMNKLRKRKTFHKISTRHIFFEIPLLFEEKLENNYDLIIFIKSNYNKRLNRVLKKGMTKNYFDLMNKYQHSAELKQSKSDITILNNGSLFDLYESLNWCEKQL